MADSELVELVENGSGAWEFNALDSALDCKSLRDLSISVIDALGAFDARFKNFAPGHKRRKLNNPVMKFHRLDKTKLFTPQDGINRDLSKNEKDWITHTIGSFLRLVSDYLSIKEVPDAWCTVEYIVRIYSGQCEWRDLLHCALPYYYHANFVNIVHLLPNAIDRQEWAFLPDDAPPPRRLLVQKCKDDQGVLKSLLDYATQERCLAYPTVAIFTSTLIQQVLSTVTRLSQLPNGSITLIKQFVEHGVHSSQKRLEEKAAALMVISSLSRRFSLNKKLRKAFMTQITWIAKAHGQEPDRKWLQTSLLALANFVQLQRVPYIPHPSLQRLHDTQDFSGVLLKLSREFYIENFLSTLLVSLVLWSSDNQLRQMFLSIITTIPLNSLLINAIGLEYMKHGGWDKEIFAAIRKVNPDLLEAPIQKSNLPNTKTPVLSCLDPNEPIQAILQQLEALSLEHIPSPDLLDALFDVLERFSNMSHCNDLLSDASQNVQLVFDVVALSLKVAVSSFGKRADSIEKLTSGFLSVQQQVVDSFSLFELSHVASVFSKGLCSGLEDLFFFFATTRSAEVFSKQLLLRLEEEEEGLSPISFQTKIISREDVDPLVRIESIRFFECYCCSGKVEECLLNTTALLIPLSSDNEELKVAAMNGLEKLRNLTLPSYSCYYLGEMAKEKDLTQLLGSDICNPDLQQMLSFV